MSPPAAPSIVESVTDSHRFVAPARLIAALTMFSRLLGMVREMVYAYFFGTGPMLSAFRVAWQIPNLFRRLFGEGALSAAFVPIFTDCLHHRGETEARRTAGTLLCLLGLVLAAIVVVAELGIGIAHWIHPSLTLQLTGAVLPYAPLICMTALVGAMLNVLNRFAAPAFAPALLNIVIIAGALVGGLVLGMSVRPLLFLIAILILVGGMLQLATLLVSLRRTGFRLIIATNWRDPEIRRVVTVMVPMVLGMSAVQINTLADSLIALLLVPDGRGPAVLGYAQILYQLPLGVLGVALATAIFPLLSARATAGDLAGVARVAGQGIRMSLFIGVPSAVGLCLISGPLIRAFFERGEFAAGDSVRAARSLVFYGAAVWAFFLQQMLVRAFYAVKESRTPARVAVVMVVVNVGLNLALVFPLGESGVALATAICAVLQVTWLAWLLRGRLPELPARWLWEGAWRIVLATAALVVAVYLPAVAVGSERWAAFSPIVRVVAMVVTGATAYAAVAWGLRLQEFRELLRFGPKR